MIATWCERTTLRIHARVRAHERMLAEYDNPDNEFDVTMPTLGSVPDCGESFDVHLHLIAAADKTLPPDGINSQPCR